VVRVFRIVTESFMASQQTGSFASWTSPITADAVVAETGSLLEPRIDGDNICWIEGRPLEKGRNVVVARTADGTVRDITPTPFDARSQVYSYGGGAYAVNDSVVHFVNVGDSQIYQQVAGGAPAKITSHPNCLFSDICVDVRRNRLIAIREERPNGDVINAIHMLVAIDIATGREATLDSAYDFYSSPTLNADGSKLAWLSWRHPNMPWAATYLNAANVDQAGTLTEKQVVEGGSESLFQPQWSPLRAQTEWIDRPPPRYFDTSCSSPKDVLADIEPREGAGLQPVFLRLPIALVCRHRA
jgi:hypothetical protein